MLLSITSLSALPSPSLSPSSSPSPSLSPPPSSSPSTDAVLVPLGPAPPISQEDSSDLLDLDPPCSLSLAGPLPLTDCLDADPCNNSNSVNLLCDMSSNASTASSALSDVHSASAIARWHSDASHLRSLSSGMSSNLLRCSTGSPLPDNSPTLIKVSSIDLEF